MNEIRMELITERATLAYRRATAISFFRSFALNNSAASSIAGFLIDCFDAADPFRRRMLR
jgi:hypothetical protein